jgi:hypothetical protein
MSEIVEKAGELADDLGRSIEIYHSAIEDPVEQSDEPELW